MRGPFVRAFLTGLALSAVTICGLGIGAAWLLVPFPPERFATATFSFNLAPGWSCVREATEYVCRLSEPPSDSIIIMAMKYRAFDDTLAKYEEHLRTPRPAIGGGGQAEIISIRRVTIAGLSGLRESSAAPRYAIMTLHTWPAILPK